MYPLGQNECRALAGGTLGMGLLQEVADAGTADGGRESTILMARVQGGRSRGRLRPSRANHSVSVPPLFSPSRAAVPAIPFLSATAVVELEASVFEPAQKPRHRQEIEPPQ